MCLSYNRPTVLLFFSDWACNKLLTKQSTFPRAGTDIVIKVFFRLNNHMSANCVIDATSAAEAAAAGRMRVASININLQR